MTKILNLYGGPGTGKSTTAAYLYYRLKELGKNVELVREYVKDWAWENRNISEYDQFYFMGKQMRRESMLYGKVDYIVTDAPVAMNCLYANKYCSKITANAIKSAVKAYLTVAEIEDRRHRHILLARTKKYNPSGRFQTESEAKALDSELASLLFMLNGELIKESAGAVDMLFSDLGTIRDDLDLFIENLVKEENEEEL